MLVFYFNITFQIFQTNIGFFFKKKSPCVDFLKMGITRLCGAIVNLNCYGYSFQYLVIVFLDFSSEKSTKYYSFSSNPNMNDKRSMAQKKTIVEIVFAPSNSKVRETRNYWNDGNPLCDVVPT